ncbi:MAG: SDR family oxidoreductase [Gemmatimonadaceae bacterium]
MQGRVCLVTGANRGIGRATALGLAQMGATVAMLCRDAERGAFACQEVRGESGNERVSLVVIDLASLESIRSAAAEIERRFPSVHVLINNAGVNHSRRTMTADGFEMTFAVNHLGPFLLTSLLLPRLRAGAPSRIINVTSVFERLGRVAFKDLHAYRRYSALRAYTQSKLATVLFTYELSERLRGTGVTVNCVSPGLVATDLLRDRFWWSHGLLRKVWNKLLLTPERAAGVLVHLAATPEMSSVTGQCFNSRARPMRTSRISYSVEKREQLWRVSAQLTGAGATDTGF